MNYLSHDFVFEALLQTTGCKSRMSAPAESLIFCLMQDVGPDILRGGTEGLESAQLVSEHGSSPEKQSLHLQPNHA